MKQTEKLKLNLIEPQDPVSRAPFNANAQILEAFSKTLLTPETAKQLGLNPQTATVDQALAKEILERKKNTDAISAQGRQLTEVQGRIGLRKIFTWSPPDSNQYELLVPLTSIAWEKYSTVHIFIEMHQPSHDPNNTHNDQQYVGYLNKNNTSYTIAYHQKGLLQLILFPGGNRNAIVGGLVVGGEKHGVLPPRDPNQGSHPPITYQQLKELHLYAHSSLCRFQTSSRVTVYAE